MKAAAYVQLNDAVGGFGSGLLHKKGKVDLMLVVSHIYL
jgi:hypothetical protein